MFMHQKPILCNQLVRIYFYTFSRWVTLSIIYILLGILISIMEADFHRKNFFLVNLLTYSHDISLINYITMCKYNWINWRTYVVPIKQNTYLIFLFFYYILVIVFPILIWRPGKTAESLRAASCLCAQNIIKKFTCYDNNVLNQVYS